MLNGVILSGGLSKRMGQDKGLLMLDGKTTVERLYEKIAPLCQRVILVTNKPDSYRSLLNKMPKATIITDEIKQLGPLSGIHAALGETDMDYNLVIACDMPLANPECFLSFAKNQLDSKNELIIARTADGRLQPLHAIYHKSCRSQIEQMLTSNNLRISSLVDYVTSKIIEIPTKEQEMFMNMNTPEEYNAALASTK
ncbi:molybdenum cofactor guanylyltransferase [Desulfuribacillus alkaliarsenatis]|uniref:Probable molybdenum cofactor guanylyltransferase n=1 Tax=Desulfuribacillus alkaliarsenatis TaxID=766136 RepID=A0A1E5G1W3_9FIRM|nr:molybdenum cofactor guanylyltransferase [Desulfuribacillus alkaliarsenatis]OEF96969.1 hypothetical protein BHF68_05025 [Desulfuribacillus alkaliarsenatis]